MLFSGLKWILNTAAFSRTRVDYYIRVTWAPSLSRHLLIVLNHIMGKNENGPRVWLIPLTLSKIRNGLISQKSYLLNFLTLKCLFQTEKLCSRGEHFSLSPSLYGEEKSDSLMDFISLNTLYNHLIPLTVESSDTNLLHLVCNRTCYTG